MKRIIPVFLLKGKRLVKGTQFHNFVDVGDPVSQAMIYDAQGADEIALVDIEATCRGGLIDTRIIREMVDKCRLPIAAGGGIASLGAARKCFQAGADKIIVNTAAVLFPDLIKKLSREFGAQAVLVSLDVKKLSSGDYAVFSHSGKKRASSNLTQMLQNLPKGEVGEVMVTSIEREGTLSGFDSSLYRKIRSLIDVPLIASGGAGSYDDLVELFKTTGAEAAALGKMLCLRDYDIVRIKSYLKGRLIKVREA